MGIEFKWNPTDGEGLSFVEPDVCVCDDKAWRLVVEESQATVVCRECNKEHPSLYDYPEDIWYEQDVTVEILDHRNYYGEVDIEVIIEAD